jgi:cobaltochelatase CobN
VEATWGKASGDIMVYEGNFVISTVQFGNVNFIPQPTKAWLSDESLLYHNKSIPTTHQYLATSFWINNVFDADAIIHFGTHGTQEWLPGKEVGLSRYDYSAILVNDTPVVYPYIPHSHENGQIMRLQHIDFHLSGMVLRTMSVSAP